MRAKVRSARSGLLARCAFVALVGGLAAGCSSDFTRLAQAPVPSAGMSGGDHTGAISTGPMGGMNGPVQSAGMPPAQGQQTYSPPNDPAFVGGNNSTGWTTEGGSSVTLREGDTVDSLAARYGVPAAAIRSANQLSAPPRAGQTIVIPVYRYADGSSTSAAPQQSQPSQSAQAGQSTQPAGGAHEVTSGETLYSLARRYNVSVSQIAQANNMSTDQGLRIGQRVTIPGGAGTAMAQSQPQQEQQTAASQPQTPPAVDEDVPFQTADQANGAAENGQASAENGNGENGSQVQQAAYVPPASDPSRTERQSAPLPEPGQRAASNFRWPVRGRVIGTFGESTNGQRNDGINLSVPEGTPIKAAENGVVVYSGSELQGFGNLILVRHADDWVTAYAHNSELLVKRGDEVRRGQIISRAGRTGNVSSPQLHFEIRRGSTPVDPMKHLSDA